MTRRIGVLTFHHVINEGAILQTYSLFQRLTELFPGDVVEVIDYRSLSAENGYRKQAFLGTRRPRRLLSNISRFFNVKGFIRRHLNLSGRSITTDDYDRALEFVRHGGYDLIVAGSDEIWKIEKGAFARPFPNIYWLGKDLPGMKVSYAASANKLAYREVSVEHQAWMSEALQRFDLLGVRDNHTLDMLGHFRLPNLGRAYKVPDPTFLLAIPDLPLKAKLKQWGLDLDRPTVGITFHADGLSGPLLSGFRSLGYQSVAISAYNPHADFNLAGRLDPFEWAVIFRHFGFCLTSLFHGTIFSLKNHCPFLSFDYFSSSPYETKLQCLLKEFDLNDRYLDAQGRTPSVDAILEKSRQIILGHNADDLKVRLDAKAQEGNRFLDLARAAMK